MTSGEEERFARTIVMTEEVRLFLESAIGAKDPIVMLPETVIAKVRPDTEYNEGVDGSAMKEMVVV